ncbi:MULTISPECIES: DUF3040 domain-containing protein [unclassified Streptomyces]|uniref:DUF3040 domain-containing protein n=1 Tax=unclassified Streptomyces TaxID=2593676 RepID=UPI0027E44DB0|nr:DUF3040 domain-containing protein [Streptomyces sp. G1]
MVAPPPDSPRLPTTPRREEEDVDRSHERQLVEIESRLYREDPRFAEGLGNGQPCRPREYRHTRAWLLLGAALAVLAVGIALAHGLLIATGLVLGGMAGEMFDPQRPARRHRNFPPRPRPQRSSD